ncbi:MAG: Replication factor C large subunit [Candidatus Heimdallarchaeota archaeon LC_2]|nr:MAG: Replication factor C large subunit [Candidatus Heimdallarchaeota archaeon LC_2]
MVNLPWVEKYRPISKTELVGNVDVINQLYNFLNNWKYKKSQTAILLLGPPGCGKTSATYAIAKDLNYIITEVNASDARSKNKIKENLSITSEFKRLDFEDKRQLILMDEIDGLSGRYDRGGLNEFINIIKVSRFPIVCTANDPDSDKIQILIRRMKIKTLIFHRLDEFEVMELLQKIAKKENFKIDENTLELIAESSAGDLRASINELESHYYGSKSVNLEKRDKAQVLTENFNNLFKAKNFFEANAVWKNAPSTYLPLLLHLFDQASKQCKTPKEVYDTYSNIANADLILSRIMTTQNWGLLKYFFTFIGPGIALSKDPKYYNRIIKLNKLPNQFKLRGMAKNKHLKANKIGIVVTPKLHISKRKFVYEEFDIFTKIVTGINGAQIAAWLDLDDEDLLLLQKIHPDSNLLEEIEEARLFVGEIRRKQGLNVESDILTDHFVNFKKANENKNVETKNNEDEEVIINQKQEETNFQKSLDDFF